MFIIFPCDKKCFSEYKHIYNGISGWRIIFILNFNNYHLTALQKEWTVYSLPNSVLVSLLSHNFAFSCQSDEHKMVSPWFNLHPFTCVLDVYIFPSTILLMSFLVAQIFVCSCMDHLSLVIFFFVSGVEN